MHGAAAASTASTAAPAASRPARSGRARRHRQLPRTAATATAAASPSNAHSHKTLLTVGTVGRPTRAPPGRRPLSRAAAADESVGFVEADECEDAEAAGTPPEPEHGSPWITRFGGHNKDRNKGTSGTPDEPTGPSGRSDRCCPTRHRSVSRTLDPHANPGPSFSRIERRHLLTWRAISGRPYWMGDFCQPQEGRW